MQNFIIFSDLHFHEHPIFLPEPGQENPFVKIGKSVLDQIDDFVQKNNSIKYVVFAGDMFHSRNKVSVELVSYLQRFFHRLEQDLNIQSFILRGNPSHEGEGTNYIGNLLGYMANVITLPCRIGGFHFLPYAPKPILLKQLNEWKKEKEKNKILITHFGLQGAKITDYELPGEETLSKEDLKDFDYVFSGHYHKAQEVWKNAWQVGSPYRISFAEKNDPKGFLFYSNGQIEFIELDVPGMHEIIIDGKTNSTKEVLTAAENYFLKIILKGSDSFIKNFDYDWYKKEFPKALGIRFETQRIDDEKVVREARINKTDNPEQMVARYMEFVQEQIGDLDDKKLKRIAQLALKG